MSKYLSTRYLRLIMFLTDVLAHILQDADKITDNVLLINVNGRQWCWWAVCGRAGMRGPRSSSLAHSGALTAGEYVPARYTHPLAVPGQVHGPSRPGVDYAVGDDDQPAAFSD